MRAQYVILLTLGSIVRAQSRSRAAIGNPTNVGNRPSPWRASGTSSVRPSNVLNRPSSSRASARPTRTADPATDFSRYPTLDVVPPINNLWSRKFLNGSIPKTPRNSQQLANPDWSKDIKTCNNPKDWGLTFDDGPSPSTMQLLDDLEAENVKATFFVIGSRVTQHSAAMAAAYRAGHQIALHSWSHSAFTTLTDEQIVAEIMWNALAIKQVIGVTPKFFRPPYGDIDDRVRAILKSLGLHIIMWDVDSQDGNDGGASQTTAQNFADQIAQSRNGSISLEHDLYDDQVNQLGEALTAIYDGEYTVKRLDNCLGLRAYDESLWNGLNFTIAGTMPNSSNTTRTSTQSAASISTTTIGLVSSKTTSTATSTPTATSKVGQSNVKSNAFSSKVTPFSSLVVILFGFILFA